MVAVGPEEVLGVDRESGEQAWSVERGLGPSVPAAVATLGGAELVVYTEGFGDGPPDRRQQRVCDRLGQRVPLPG